MIGTELFSSASQKWADSLAQLIGGKILLLTCLFLIAGLMSFYILLRSQSKYRPLEIVQSDLSKSVEKLDGTEIIRSRENLLCNLAKDEKTLLLSFLNKDTKCINISNQNTAAISLQSRGILYFAPQVTNMNHMLKSYIIYCISDWAWEMLKESPKYLK
jgi:hypothetical protein